MSQSLLVDITVHAVKLTLNADIHLNVIWKRKSRRVETRNKVFIPSGSGSIPVEQTLTGEEYEDNLKLQAADLYLQALLSGGAKVVGKLTLPLSSIPLSQLKFPIKYCPDPSAYIVLSLSSRSREDERPTPDSPIIIERPAHLSLNKRVSLSSSTKADDSKDWKATSRLGKSVDWSDHFEDIQREVETLREENKEIKRRNKTLTDEFRRKQEEFDSRLQELDYEKGRLVRALERSEKELKDVTQLQSDHSRISVDIYQQTITELTKKLQMKEVELALLRQELRGKTDQKQVEELKGVADELKKQLKSEQEKSLGLTLNIEQLQTALRDATQRMERRDAASDGERTAGEEREAIMREAAKRLTETEEKWRREVDVVRRETAACLRARDTEIRELQSDLRETLTALERVSQRPLLRIQTGHVVEIQSKTNTESPLGILASQMLAMKLQLQSVESSRKSDMEKFSGKCAVLERHISSLDSTRKKLETDNERLRFENKQLRGEGASTQTDEKKREKELFELELMVKYAQEERFAVEQKFAELKMNAAKENAEREELWERARKAEEELREVSRKYAEMETQFVKVNEHLGQLLNQHNDLEQEAQSLRSRLPSQSPTKTSSSPCHT